MADGTNGQGHCGLGWIILCIRGHRPGTKKAGRFPVRDEEGPAKNLLLKRWVYAQQDTSTQWSLQVFHIQQQKICNQTWPVFIVFCGNNRCKEPGSDFRMPENQIQTLIYPSFRKKSSPILFFLEVFCSLMFWRITVSIGLSLQNRLFLRSFLPSRR